MRKQIALILTLLLALPSVALPEGNASPLTPEQKLEDIEFLCSELEQNHYDLFSLVDEAAWQTRVSELTEDASAMSDMDFCLSLMALVASLGDSHTRAGLTGAAKEKLGALPLQLMWFEDEVRLVAAVKAYEPYLGQKLVSVAGLTIPELMERFRGFISYDNEAWYQAQFVQYLIGAEYLSYLAIINTLENVDVVFEDDQGIQSSVSVHIEYGELYNLEFVVAQRAQIPLAQQARQIYYTTALTEDALLISYHACQEDPNLPMAEFMEQVQTQLQESAFQKVLVDLRYNGGGNSAIFEPMIAMLGEMKDKLGFELYAMIGENTFSSALMNAVQIKMRSGAVLVGQPTGGSVNHYGEIVTCALPNAEVTFIYSTKFFNMAPGYGIDSLKPDVEIVTSYQDFIEGKDPEIEYILSAK